ncbi:MAG: GNAT family N-acetyltransferase [Pseudomonadota bacterium]
MTRWTIRPYRQSDAEALSHLMHQAIHEGAAGAYDKAQRQAWSPAPWPDARFSQRIAGQHCRVGVDASGAAGFMTLTAEGRIDLAFVRPDRMGSGLAGALYEALLVTARQEGFSRLTVEASHLARPFFERRGWTLERSQTIERDGISLENHLMAMELDG